MSAEADRRAEDAVRLCTLGEQAFDLARRLTEGIHEDCLYTGKYDIRNGRDRKWDSMAVGTNKPSINLQLRKWNEKEPHGIVFYGIKIRSLWLEPVDGGYKLIFHHWPFKDGEFVACPIGYRDYDAFYFTKTYGLRRSVRGTDRFTTRINAGEREIVAQAVVILRDRLQKMLDQPEAA